MLVSFKSRETPEKSLKKSFQSDCGCDSLWSMPVTNDFVRILEKTTLSNRSVWKGYKLGDGNFVLNAGKLNDSTHCLGLWKKGKVISYTCSKDVPTMLTPLYSYYLNYKKSNETDSTLFGTFNKSPGFSLWMKHNHVESAVYMPTDFPKFPFKITAKTKTQIAIHEAFHIEVMLRYWFTKKGSWPQWDIQPDRAGVQSCYSETEFVQRLIEEEQNTLSLFVEALMDNKKSEAIVLGNSFLKARETRYNLLNEKQIKLKGDVYGDCKTAEEIMEIEEGIADYASWVIMYNIGMVSRDELLQRYRAQQNDRFYLTGCMLLHASVLMNNGKASEIIKKIVTANSLDEGNLLHIFKTQLGLFSKN
ncbi:MAG: hypothetical protein ABI844_17950 [Saprospiraceae bacterium]